MIQYHEPLLQRIEIWKDSWKQQYYNVFLINWLYH